MKKRSFYGMILAGFGAGAINGLFGAGGGMVLAPLMSILTDLPEQQIFPCSVAILLPICITSLLMTQGSETLSWATVLPYLIGSFFGGLAAGHWGKSIPTHWLHRILGIMILWGGIRYLWS